MITAESAWLRGRWGGEYVLVRIVWQNGGVTSSVSQ